MGLISNGSTIFDNGSMASGFGGSMVFIKKLTASSSATLSFVDGTDGVVLDDSFKEYYITFNNIHPSNDDTDITFQASTDSGSSYGITITSTYFQAQHSESGTGDNLTYVGAFDLAQSTSYQTLGHSIGIDNDQTGSGSLSLFSPSNTTFVKHFMSRINVYHASDFSIDNNVAGYFNTISAINAIRFQMSSGNIDAGDICLYGIA